MNGPKLKNELTKSAWKMSANIKDTVSKNIVRAANNKDIPIPREQLQRLVNLVQASVDAAFEGSLKDFQKEIEKLLPEDGSKKK